MHTHAIVVYIAKFQNGLLVLSLDRNYDRFSLPSTSGEAKKIWSTAKLVPVQQKAQLQSRLWMVRMWTSVAETGTKSPSCTRLNSQPSYEGWAPGDHLHNCCVLLVVDVWSQTSDFFFFEWEDSPFALLFVILTHSECSKLSRVAFEAFPNQKQPTWYRYVTSSATIFTKIAQSSKGHGAACAPSPKVLLGSLGNLCGFIFPTVFSCILHQLFKPQKIHQQQIWAFGMKNQLQTTTSKTKTL